MYTILKLLGKTPQHFILLSKKGTCRAQYRYLRKHSDRDEQFFRRAMPILSEDREQTNKLMSTQISKKKEKKRKAFQLKNKMT